MPYPFQKFSLSDYLNVDINSHTECQIVQIQISWLLRSQLIWIYTVCKGREYPGSARQGFTWINKEICIYWMFGLDGSVRCTIRLETRRSRIQPPPRSATFFRGDWSWNIFYGHSLPSADSRRAVVSFWRKNVQNTGSPLRGLRLSSKRVVR